jgi:hypothetical protein
MVAGLPYTALRDPMLTPPTLVEGSYPVVLLRAFGLEIGDLRFKCNPTAPATSCLSDPERTSIAPAAVESFS